MNAVMQTYGISDIGDLIRDNPYVGRGIVIGESANGSKAVCAYFIMGRSANSRNRVFKTEGETVWTAPFDPSKVEDPSLIIYAAVRAYQNHLIVTNGDQTDTIFSYLQQSKRFEDALDTREFEPDRPNFTPRISGMLTFDKQQFTYKMNILKSEDPNGAACGRYTFAYTPLPGLGHFLHTYMGDGDPLPTFCGEPERVCIPDNIDAFTETLWSTLHPENKISLYVRYTDLSDGSYVCRLKNKNR